jgi:hypothetical protein
VTEDITGVWTGTTGFTMSSSATFDLKQQGSTVKGVIRFTGGANMWGVASGGIDGIVAGDVFRFRDLRGNLEGELTINGDEMAGLLSSSLGTASRIVLRRLDPSSPPASPPR